MGSGHTSLSTSIDAQVLYGFFDEKIAGVRASTNDAAPPYFVSATNSLCSAVSILAFNDVITALDRLYFFSIHC